MSGVTENADRAEETDERDRSEAGKQKLARAGHDIVRDYELFKYRLYREKYEGHGNDQ
ncbi:MAG: hypothetical protein NC184_04240 [Roseburia sp.]|nr:hypothetical protein [Roseburia sp.]